MKGGGGGGKKRYSKYTKAITEQGSLYNGGKASTDTCKTIKFNTQLQRVQPALSTVVAGDELTIQNVKIELQARNDAGKLCGYIVSPHNSKLIECIKRGYNYKAIVYTISGTVCKVTVQIV